MSKEECAQLPITAACVICNYIFSLHSVAAAINSNHLFMKGDGSESLVPPARCLQCCQQRSAHIVSIYPDVRAAVLQLSLLSFPSHTHVFLLPTHHISNVVNEARRSPKKEPLSEPQRFFVEGEKAGLMESSASANSVSGIDFV